VLFFYFLEANSSYPLQSFLFKKNKKGFPLLSGLKINTMNELHLETSPYLLQHANNPVHWKAWNTNSLAKAKKENKSSSLV